jgi:hypothetical protein
VSGCTNGGFMEKTLLLTYAPHVYTWSMRLRCAGCGKEVTVAALLVPDVGRVCDECLLPGAREAVEGQSAMPPVPTPFFS